MSLAIRLEFMTVLQVLQICPCMQWWPVAFKISEYYITVKKGYQCAIVCQWTRLK